MGIECNKQFTSVAIVSYNDMNDETNEVKDYCRL